MVTSWIEQAKQFKSPVSVVAGFLLRSRETQAERAKSRTQEIQQLKKDLDQQQQTIREQREQLAEKNLQIDRMQIENQRLRKQPPTLPDDPRLPHHEFGPKMISLCVNLARRVGLRPAPDVLKMILQWLGVDANLPDWTTVRTWMLRVGVAAIKRPIEQADDWIWMADHSNQIGPEKALAIIGLRASKMPPPGQPLTHDDVRVLELNPGTSWKREDMAAAYEQLAQRCGAPLLLLVDGAVELREGAETLQNSRENMLVLGDLKHYAANVLKVRGMENSSGRNARWSGAAAHQTEQTVEIERARQPVPFLLDPIQTAQKKTPSAQVLLDHRERPLAGMAATRVLLLRLVRCHLHRVRFTESFVLLPVDRPRFRLALNAHRQQRALRTVIRGRLVTAAFADAVAFLLARRPRVRQPLALGHQ